MGLKTHSVPMEMFAENRRRLCERLRGAEGLPEGAVILLQGGGDQVLHVRRLRRDETETCYRDDVKETAVMWASSSGRYVSIH